MPHAGPPSVGHPVVSGEGRWVSPGGPPGTGSVSAGPVHPTVDAEGRWVSDDRNPEARSLDEGLGFTASAPSGVRQPWEFQPPSGSESYFGAPGDLWAGMVDWWFSHDIPTEGLPSGGGLMIGPQEMAKLGNFLKDALLPLMAGDIGLAGAGGFIASDPVPIPAGQIIGKGADVAKGIWRAIRGFDSLADDAVIHVFHGTTAESAAAIRETGVAGRWSASRSEEVGIYVAPTRETAEMYAGVDGEVLEFTVRKRDLVSRPFDDPALDEALSGEQFYEPLYGGFLPAGTQVEVVGDVLAGGVAREAGETAREVVGDLTDWVSGVRMADHIDEGAEMWHVTRSKDLVEKEGFREGVSEGFGNRLGHETRGVSVTYSRETAESLAEQLDVAARAARGEATKEEVLDVLLRAADDDVGADELAEALGLPDIDSDDFEGLIQAFDGDAFDFHEQVADAVMGVEADRWSDLLASADEALEGRGFGWRVMALTADRANYAAIKSDQVAVLQVASSGKPLVGDVWGQELRFAADDLETVTAGGVAREAGEAAAASLDEVVTLFDPNPGYTKPNRRKVMSHEAFKEYWDEGFLGGPRGEAMSLGVEGPSTAYNMLAGQGVPEDQIAAFYVYVGQSKPGWREGGFLKQGFRNGKDFSRLSDDELQLRYGMYLEDRAAAASTAAAKVEREAAEKAASKTAKEAAAKAEAEAAPLKPAQEAVRDAVPEGKVLADLEGHEVFEDSHGALGSAGYTRLVGDGQYVDSIEVRLPPKFIEHHTSRGLGGGVEAKSMKNASVVRLTAADIVEIYSDADYYSDTGMVAEFIENAPEHARDIRSLASSAKSTMKALSKALGVPEGAPFPSRAEIEAILAAMGG